METLQQPQPYRPHSEPSPPTPRGALKDKRIEFAIFLKVLIRCLENSHQESALRQARLVVVACIRGHDMGDASFRPLEDAIEFRLKKIVDKTTWSQAKWYSKYYVARRLGRRATQFYTPHPFIQFIPSSEDSRNNQFELGVTRMAEI